MRILIGTLKPGHQAPGPGAVDVTLEPGRARLSLYTPRQTNVATFHYCQPDPADLVLTIFQVTHVYVRGRGKDDQDQVSKLRFSPTEYETMATSAGAVGVVADYDVDPWIFPFPTTSDDAVSVDYSDANHETGVSGIAYEIGPTKFVFTWATLGVDASDAAAFLMEQAENDLLLKLRNRAKAQKLRKKDLAPERIAAHRSSWLADPRHRGSLRGWQTAAQLDLGIDRKTLISYLALAESK